MATAALTGAVQTFCNAPFLIKYFTYTGGTTTSSAITHGESRAPDIYFGAASTNTSTSGALIYDSVGATTLKIATSADQASAGLAVLVWLNAGGSAAGGGLNPP